MNAVVGGGGSLSLAQGATTVRGEGRRQLMTECKYSTQCLSEPGEEVVTRVRERGSVAIMVGGLCLYVVGFLTRSRLAREAEARQRSLPGISLYPRDVPLRQAFASTMFRSALARALSRHYVRCMIYRSLAEHHLSTLICAFLVRTLEYLYVVCNGSLISTFSPQLTRRFETVRLGNLDGTGQTYHGKPQCT